MHLVVWLPEFMEDVQVSDRLLEAGVVTRPISASCQAQRLRPGLILGYAAFDEAQLRSAARCLVRTLFVKSRSA